MKTQIPTKWAGVLGIEKPAPYLSYSSAIKLEKEAISKTVALRPSHICDI